MEQQLADPAVYTDRERLTALPALPDCWIVLCKPEFGIPTPALFTLADAGTPKNRPDIEEMDREIIQGLNIQFVDNMKDVLGEALA